MSLDTVLQIGKVLRSSENSLKYFKYVKPCPKDEDGNWPICITIPVKEDFSFDWERIEITPEKDRERLYYLKFKTSDADGFVKYICAAPYFPWIFFNKEIFTYISEDSSSLNTIATDKGLKINVSFIFADSKITQLIAEYNQINDPGVKNKVTVNYGNYKDVNGNKVPDGYEIIWDKNGIINKKKVSIIEYKFY